MAKFVITADSIEKPTPDTEGLGFCGKKEDGSFYFGFSTPPNEANLNDVVAWREFIKYFAIEFPSHSLQSIWRCLFKDFEEITAKAT